jgi:hypothetical protein
MCWRMRYVGEGPAVVGAEAVPGSGSASCLDVVVGAKFTGGRLRRL